MNEAVTATAAMAHALSVAYALVALSPGLLVIGSHWPGAISECVDVIVWGDKIEWVEDETHIHATFPAALSYVDLSTLEC